MQAPAATRITEQVLNPVLGKSLVVYATKPVARSGRVGTACRRSRHDRRALRRRHHLAPTRSSSHRRRPSPRGSCPTGMIPWFPGGHADPWNHVEAAMALDLGGPHDRGRAGLRVAGRRAARRRRLAPVLPGRPHRAGQARRQRRRLRRRRRLAPLARHRRPRLRRGDVADGREGHRLRARPADPAGRDPLGPPRRRHAVVVRPAHRLVVASATACAAPSPSPSCSATSAPTGS